MFFQEYLILFPKEIFYSCEVFLLVLTFFVSIFLGKVVQSLREFAVLFANIYE